MILKTRTFSTAFANSWKRGLIPNFYSSASGAVEDYEEIFSTQGFKKKVLREIAEVKSETLAELAKE